MIYNKKEIKNCNILDTQEHKMKHNIKLSHNVQEYDIMSFYFYRNFLCINLKTFKIILAKLHIEFVLHSNLLLKTIHHTA